MRFLLVFTAGWALASLAAAEIGPDSVWQPLMGVSAQFRDECKMKPVPDVRACLRGFMERAGAKPPALELSRRLDGEGWAREFRELGRVDAVLVRYPFRANANDGVLLVNGTPELVDVASAAALKPLEDDARLAALRRGHPDAALWASDPGAPDAEERPGGGQRFVFSFPVRTCHACADLAETRVAYDFNADGLFLGTRLLTVENPPAFAVEGELSRGKAFEAPIDSTRTFRLSPFSEGWTIEVKDAAGNDYCKPVTPPYRGVNSLELFGRDFLGADGPRPDADRRFRCVEAPADEEEAFKTLGVVLWSGKASWKEIEAAQQAHERLAAAAQRGRLTLSRVVLGETGPGGRPRIESMTFRFELRPHGAEAR